MTPQPQPGPGEHVRHHATISTRWMDNNVYGQVNHTQCHSLLDTAVNRYLIDAGALDIHGSQVIGRVVETQCNYFAPPALPLDVQAGVRVAQVGRSSVRDEIGLFAPAEPLAAAMGHVVQV